MALKVFYGIKLVSCAGFLVGSIIGRHFISNPILSIIVVPAAALAGFYGPNLILERMIDRRRERLRFSLPDALDLMVVWHGGRTGPGSGHRKYQPRVAQDPPGDQRGIRAGLPWRCGPASGVARRFKNLADRSSEPELRKLVATMTQADRFGTSIAEALRTHADFMRVRRRQEAEERAGKVGVKLVFPIFFFILPAMLLVAAGPGLLQLFKGLFPIMKSFGK